MRVLARGVAGVLAVASLLPVWAGVAFALLYFVLAAHGPDPLAPEGDPCCTYADDWGEVVFGFAWGLLLVVVSVVVLYVAIALAEFAFTGGRPKLLRLRRLIYSLSAAVALSAAFTAWVFLLPD